MSWTYAIVTNAGAALLQEAIGGGQALSIAYATGGAGTVSATALAALTSLTNTKQTFVVAGYTNTDSGKKIDIQMTSLDLNTGYTLTQIGIWAQVGNDDPVLYAVLQDDDGVAIPSESEMSDFVLHFYAVLGFSGDAEIEVTVDASALATAASVSSALAEAKAYTDEKAGTGNYEAPIAEATAETVMADGDTVPFTDVSASNATKKITLANLKTVLSTWGNTLWSAVGHTHTASAIGADATGTAASAVSTHNTTSTAHTGIVATQMASATALTTVADGDTLVLTDVSASNAIKKITWANIKSALSSLYAALTHTHAGADITSGVVGIAYGGTGNTSGNAASATKLATARTVQTDLESTSSDSFNGTANITPGVTGTLPVANGGTGANALTSGNFLKGAGTSPVISVTADVARAQLGIAFGTCSTAVGTASKTVAITDFALATGARISILFTNGNTNTASTLNVNNTGAKQIWYCGSRIGTDVLSAGDLVNLVYDGTYYRILSIDTGNDTSKAYTDTKIAALDYESPIANATAETTMADGDTVPFTDVSASNVTKKITLANLKTVLSAWGNTLWSVVGHTHTASAIGADATGTAASAVSTHNTTSTAHTGIVATQMASATALTAVADGDTLVLTDVSASNAVKKITWTDIKAVLKTYFDTLYNLVTVTDSLTSTSTTAALSANQGRVLDSAKADKISSGTAGNLVVLGSDGGIADGGVTVDEVVETAALPADTATVLGLDPDDNPTVPQGLVALRRPKLLRLYNVAGAYTYTVPDGVTKILVAMIGGGGKGAAQRSNSASYAGGGASGYVQVFELTVVPGATYSLVVGAGSANTSSDGGTTSGFGVTAEGGESGQSNTSSGTAYYTFAIGGQGAICSHGENTFSPLFGAISMPTSDNEGSVVVSDPASFGAMQLLGFYLPLSAFPFLATAGRSLRSTTGTGLADGAVLPNGNVESQYYSKNVTADESGDSISLEPATDPGAGSGAVAIDSNGNDYISVSTADGTDGCIAIYDLTGGVFNVG